MAQPVSFRWDEEFVRQIDEARGLVPRSAFVRAAVEKALSREIRELDLRHGSISPEVDPPNRRTSVRADPGPKREFTPVPKGRR